MIDPVEELAHDHGDINGRVLAIGTVLRALEREPSRGVRVLVTPLDELRDVLFEHFAREEEALFPFISETFPDLVEQIDAMATAHDTICGALARMYNLASQEADRAQIAAVFDRFDRAYANHASYEAALLRDLGLRLTNAQRAQLAELVAGL
jgi:iron-sulfur cluster repair protein YtfE (RIC family)